MTIGINPVGQVQRIKGIQRPDLTCPSTASRLRFQELGKLREDEKVLVTDPGHP